MFPFTDNLDVLKVRRAISFRKFFERKKADPNFQPNLPPIDLDAAALQKDPIAVMTLANEVLDRDPKNRAAGLLFYEAAVQAGWTTFASFALETLLIADRRDTNIRLMLGNHYLTTGALDNAMCVFDSIKYLEISGADTVNKSEIWDALEAAGCLQNWGQPPQPAEIPLLVKKFDLLSWLDPDSLDVARKKAQLFEFWFETAHAEAALDASDQLKFPLEFYEFTVDGLLRTAIAAYEEVDRLSNGSDPAITQKVAELKAR